jgi:hypothetical protein
MSKTAALNLLPPHRWIELPFDAGLDRIASLLRECQVVTWHWLIGPDKAKTGGDDPHRLPQVSGGPPYALEAGAQVEFLRRHQLQIRLTRGSKPGLRDLGLCPVAQISAPGRGERQFCLSSAAVHQQATHASPNLHALKINHLGDLWG